jgi:hypothetical protein
LPLVRVRIDDERKNPFRVVSVASSATLRFRTNRSTLYVNVVIGVRVVDRRPYTLVEGADFVGTIPLLSGTRTDICR